MKFGMYVNYTKCVSRVSVLFDCFFIQGEVIGILLNLYKSLNFWAICEDYGTDFLQTTYGCNVKWVLQVYITFGDLDLDSRSQDQRLGKIDCFSISRTIDLIQMKFCTVII